MTETLPLLVSLLFLISPRLGMALLLILWALGLRQSSKPTNGGSDMNASLAAASAMALEQFPTDELCAANNAATGFGNIPPGNIAHQRAVDAGLIEPSGRIYDTESLLAALSFEVNRRLTTGPD